jgi:hypothetical protein
MQNANANCEKILIEDVWPILSINTNILHFAFCHYSSNTNFWAFENKLDKYFYLCVIQHINKKHYIKCMKGY